MNVEIGTVVEQFLLWEYLFRVFGIGSLQCDSLFLEIPWACLPDIARSCLRIPRTCLLILHFLWTVIWRGQLIVPLFIQVAEVWPISGGGRINPRKNTILSLPQRHSWSYHFGLFYNDIISYRYNWLLLLIYLKIPLCSLPVWCGKNMKWKKLKQPLLSQRIFFLGCSLEQHGHWACKPSLCKIFIWYVLGYIQHIKIYISWNRVL